MLIEISLKDIYLGNIDAKNELLNNTEEEKERFSKSFVLPPNLVIEQFTNKSKYYILGLKGTGKTALLRYLSINMEKESLNNYTSFILFKSDLDEDFRKKCEHLGRTQVITENNSKAEKFDDYEYVWRWFIYRQLVSICETRNIQLFQPNKLYTDFVNLIKSPIHDQQKSGWMKLIPNLKQGKIEISHNPSLSLEFEWNEGSSLQVDFNDLIRKADEKFELLLPGEDFLSIFFDELELNYDTKEQHERDTKLIRDLIVVIEKINAKSKQKAFNLCLYCGVRTEVQTSVASLGKEINKILKDFGTKIIWHRASTSDYEQPLLNIITERLKSSIPILGQGCSDQFIWEKFFPKAIQNHAPQEYILHHSWYRPRDIINLLKTAQDQYPNEKMFTHNVFDAIRKEYSTSSWIEMTEELKSKYSNNEIRGIKTLLYGYKQVFSLSDLRQRATILQEKYEKEEVIALLKEHKLPTILGDLYRIGVIGNVDRSKFRFSFRGDDEILIEQDFYVHNGLKAFLSI